MSISTEIKDIRRKCLLNQTEFAEAIGVSFSTEIVGKMKMQFRIVRY